MLSRSKKKQNWTSCGLHCSISVGCKPIPYSRSTVAAIHSHTCGKPVWNRSNINSTATMQNSTTCNAYKTSSLSSMRPSRGRDMDHWLRQSSNMMMLSTVDSIWHKKYIQLVVKHSNTSSTNACSLSQQQNVHDRYKSESTLTSLMPRV